MEARQRPKVRLTSENIACPAAAAVLGFKPLAESWQAEKCWSAMAFLETRPLDNAPSVPCHACRWANMRRWPSAPWRRQGIVGAVVWLTVASLVPPRATDTEPPLTLADCLARALAQHPEVEVARQQVDEAAARVRERRGAERPQVDFATTWFQYDWLLPNKEKILGEAPARAREQAATARRERLRQQIVQGVTNAASRLDDALARWKVTEQAVALARQVLIIEQERYRVGMGSSLEVIDAQPSPRPKSMPLKPPLTPKSPLPRWPTR